MTFLADMTKKGYFKKKIVAVLVESEQDKKRKRMLTIVTETVNAYRLHNERPPSIREASSLEENKWFRYSCGWRGQFVSWTPTYSGRIHCEFEVRFAKVEKCNLDAC